MKNMRRKEQLFSFIERNKRLPSRSLKTKGTLEYILAEHLYQAIHEKNPVFTLLAKQHGWKPFRRANRKAEILDFYDTNGVWPRRRSNDKAERSLASSLSNYTLKLDRKHQSFSEKFLQRVRRLDPCFCTHIPHTYRPRLNKLLRTPLPIREELKN